LERKRIMNEDTQLLLMWKEKSLYQWFICYILPGPCRTLEHRVAIWFGLFRFFKHEQSSYFCRGPDDFCWGPAPVGPTLVTGSAGLPRLSWKKRSGVCLSFCANWCWPGVIEVLYDTAWLKRVLTFVSWQMSQSQKNFSTATLVDYFWYRPKCGDALQLGSKGKMVHSTCG